MFKDLPKLAFVLGTFLEEVSTILITVPVILPLMTSIGYDGIWFGIFVTVMATGFSCAL